MVQDCLDVAENYPRLVFVFRETQYTQRFADGDERLEVHKAGDETGNQSGDETFSTATTDYEIGFFRAVERGRHTPRVALENQQLVNGHGQTENGFQHDEPRCPGLKGFEARQRTEQPLVLDGFDDVWLAPISVLAVQNKKAVGTYFWSLTALGSRLSLST